MAPRLQEDTADKKSDCPLTPVKDEELCSHDCYFPIEQDELAPQSEEDHKSRAFLNVVPRRSSRINKGIFPLRCGVDQE